MCSVPMDHEINLKKLDAQKISLEKSTQSSITAVLICIIGALKKTLLNQSNYKNVTVHQEYIQMADMDILSERIELITRFLQTGIRNETK